MFQSLLEVHVIVGLVSGLVRFLYASSCRCVVVSHSEAYHRAVGHLDRSLHESFPECSPSDNNAAVLVLYSPRDDFGCRGGVFIDEDDNLPVNHPSPSVGFPLVAWDIPTVGIDYEVAVGQELVGYFLSRHQIPTPVVLEVEDEVEGLSGILPLVSLTQRVDGCCYLFVSVSAESSESDISYSWLYEISGVHGFHGYLVALYPELYRFALASPLDADLHHGPFLSTETFHDVSP